MMPLKLSYNKMLDRFYKAEKFMEDQSRTEEEIEKYLPLFKQIIWDLNSLLSEIGEYTNEEAMEGFKV